MSFHQLLKVFLTSEMKTSVNLQSGISNNRLSNNQVQFPSMEILNGLQLENISEFFQKFCACVRCFVVSLRILSALRETSSCLIEGNILSNIWYSFDKNTAISPDSGTFKGLCHPRRMRALIRSTLKSLAQLFQIPSESSGSCFYLFESRSSSES